MIAIDTLAERCRKFLLFHPLSSIPNHNSVPWAQFPSTIPPGIVLYSQWKPKSLELKGQELSTIPLFFGNWAQFRDQKFFDPGIVLKGQNWRIFNISTTFDPTWFCAVPKNLKISQSNCVRGGGGAHSRSNTPNFVTLMTQNELQNVFKICQNEHKYIW